MDTDHDETLATLATRIHAFNVERNWQSYHTPKNLAGAIVCEAAELLELFQWLTPGQSEALTTKYRAAVAAEMADVLIFTLSLATRLEIDLTAAIIQKLDGNARKYPIGRDFNPYRKAQS